MPPDLHVSEAIPGITVFGDIVPGSKIPPWFIVLIVLVTFALVAIVGVFAFRKFVTGDKKIEDIEAAQPTTEQGTEQTIGSKNDKSFLAQYFTIAPYLVFWTKLGSPPDTLQPTDTELAPVSQTASLPLILQQHAQRRNADHFAQFRAKKRDKGDAFGQATQKAINTIQGWGKYERNANPYHPR
jgi:hypothetical protein